MYVCMRFSVCYVVYLCEFLLVSVKIIMHITKSVITSSDFSRQLLIFFVTRMFVIIKNNYFCLLNLAYRHLLLESFFTHTAFSFV